MIHLSGLLEPQDVRRARDRLYHRLWYHRNKEKAKAKRLRHAEYIKAYDKIYREKNKEKLREYHRAYYARKRLAKTRKVDWLKLCGSSLGKMDNSARHSTNTSRIVSGPQDTPEQNLTSN